MWVALRITTRPSPVAAHRRIRKSFLMRFRMQGVSAPARSAVVTVAPGCRRCPIDFLYRMQRLDDSGPA